MKILYSAVKCDSCGWTKKGPSRIVIDYWKKRCPRCGAANVIKTKDLIQWMFLILFMLVSIPIEWVIVNVFKKGSGPHHFRLESENGEFYTVKEIKDEKRV